MSHSVDSRASNYPAALKFSLFLLAALLLAHILPILSRLAAVQMMPLFPAQTRGETLYKILAYAFQVAFVLILLLPLTRGNLRTAGFNLQDRKEGFRFLWIFLAVWTGVVVAYLLIGMSVSAAVRQYVLNINSPGLDALIRDLFGGVIAGPGEEPLYRSLVLCLLLKGLGEGAMERKGTRWALSLLSGLIFSSAHIGYELFPRMVLTHLDPLQLAFTFVLGTVWSLIYLRTKSLLIPVLAHSGANAMQYALGHLAAVIIRHGP